MKVLIVGSVALDTIKTPFGKAKDILGGSAVYSSVSASNFAPVNLVGIVGEDFPKIHIVRLMDKNINLKGLEIVKNGKTFRWEGEYDWSFSDPKTLATHLNVFAEFNPVIPAQYRDSEFLFLANIDPVIQNKVLDQVDRPKLTLCDTMNYWIASKRAELIKLIKKVDIFLLNESEAKQLSGEAGIVKAVKAIFKMGAKRLIVKKGEHGAMLFSETTVFCAPAYLLESVYDPTGAGDTFAGGFIGYLAKCGKVTETNLRRAIIYGNIMATFTVEDFSLRRLAKITKKDIEKRFNEYKKLTYF